MPPGDARGSGRRDDPSSDDAGRLTLSDGLGRPIRNAEIEATMRPGVVVMMNAATKHGLKMSAPADKQVVEAFLSDRSDPRSTMAFAFGALIDVRITCTPSVVKISSKGPQNFLSRSWMRNVSGSFRLSRWNERFLACSVTRAPSGLARAAGDVHLASGKLDDEKQIRARVPTGCRR